MPGPTGSPNYSADVSEHSEEAALKAAEAREVAPRREVSAAIDIGSSSINLLVATDSLERIDGRSELLGLGEAVERLGRIEPDDRGLILNAIEDYVDLARAAGARRITLIGTEPLRRAANASEVVALVRSVTGLALRVVTVEQEAQLAFIGACAGRVPDRPTAVLDVGSSTTLISLYKSGDPITVETLKLGSARLTWTIVEHDPPTERELGRLAEGARDVLADLPETMFPDPRVVKRGRARLGLAEPPEPVRAIFVGATATNLARLGPLSRAALADDVRQLGVLSVGEVVRRYGVRPQRARQLAAGAQIVDALLERLGLEEGAISDASLRDGAILAAARFGDAWPAHLGELLSKS
ncbi:MAG: exopolyphosphatase / guanosine-5-triphosphate,3-diphosphate pyrophosphatase [Chloroflexota bacterium]|nr:exopolyphosphatase / guanosine-5-triphosphate,3-diphosphate pyrophosphatase [Chloroflexota bacterium]